MKLPRFIVGKNTTESNRNPLNVPQENVLSLRRKDDFKIEINFTKVRVFFQKNRKFVGPLAVLSIALIIFLVAIRGKASIVNFYPETCLGGWENPSNASGQPSVASDAQGSDFTRDNSAFLRNRTAQMFCGDFGGEVPDDSIPRKFTVRFSWFVDDGSYDKGEKIINEALDEGRTTIPSLDSIIGTENENSQTDDTSLNSGSEETTTPDAINENTSVPSNENGSSDLPAGETASQDENTSDSEPSQGSTGSDSSASDSSSESGSDSSGSEGSGEGAYLERFFNYAFAQETESVASEPETQSVAESTEVKEELTSDTQVESHTAETQNPASVDDTTEKDITSAEIVQENSESDENEENQNLESNGIVSLDETARDDLFRVMYTIDGEKWEELGVVKRNNWKNVEFEIPISNVDSWEKLSKVQIAIESLPTIDSFPETHLDSVWISVEYEGVNPDPLPQPDFLTDKVLNDIRYENFRVIRIMKPSGEFQIWYALIPSELLTSTNQASDDVVKTGDTGLQVIDASTIKDYDPLVGPLENSSLVIKPQEQDFSTTEINPSTTPEEIQADIEKSQNNESTSIPSESDLPQVLGVQTNSIEENPQLLQESEKNIFEKINDIVQTDTSIKDSQTEDSQVIDPTLTEEKALNENTIKKEGEVTDLQDLNQPLWYWNLIAKGEEVSSTTDISVDNYNVFWVNEKINILSQFNVSSSGSYSSSSFDTEKIGTLSFVAPSGMIRFARFNKETSTFLFSDE